MRLLCYLLPAVGLLAGCAERMPATEARVVQVAYMPPYMPEYAPTARRAFEDVGRAPAAAPNLDLDKICRAVERTDDAEKNRHYCIEDEREAEIELQRRWSTFSATERSACISSSTGGVEPSYVELLTCFEMASGEGPSKYGFGTHR